MADWTAGQSGFVTVAAKADKKVVPWAAPMVVPWAALMVVPWAAVMVSDSVATTD